MFKIVNKNPSEQFVQTHLEKYVKKKGQKSWFMVCPFHADKDPSLSVVVKQGKLAVGFWRCFGCGRKGYWNELATALNMPTIDGTTFDVSETESIDFDVEETKLGTTFICGKKEIKKKSLIPWPENRIWRGFSGRVVRHFGGYLNILDFDYPLVFLCRNRKALNYSGLVLCRAKKREKRPSYLFTNGIWTSQFLWPEHKIELTKTIVIVEGLRDALAWLCLGVPTLALFGTQTGISLKRFNMLMGLGVEKIILFLDGDKAGKNAVMGTYKKKELVKEGLRSILEKDFEVQIMRTWKYYPGKDPFSLAKNKQFVKKFMKNIERFI